MHFEDLWNEAEKVGLSEPVQPENIDYIVNKIQNDLNKFILLRGQPIEQGNLIGEIIFDIGRICARVPINSYKALKNAVEEHNKEMFDPDDNDA